MRNKTEATLAKLYAGAFLGGLGIACLMIVASLAVLALWALLAYGVAWMIHTYIAPQFTLVAEWVSVFLIGLVISALKRS